MTPLWVAVIGGLFSVGLILLKQRFERRSLNIAILAEVNRLYTVVDKHKAYWVKCISNKTTNLPLIPFTTPVFDAQTANIGQIDKKIVATVVEFFGYLKFINAFQLQRAAYASTSNTAAFDGQYLHVLEHLLTDFREPFKRAYAKYALAGARGTQLASNNTP